MAETRKPEKDPSLYHVPPQNLEAEESILSAILINNNALLDVIGVLRDEDFYKPGHRKIFSAVCELFNRNDPVDLVTLANILKQRGDIEEIGGAAYLASLVDSVPLAVNCRHYAQIVHEKACLRLLIEKSQDIVKRCLEDRERAEDIIDFAENEIFKIAENKITPSFYAIKDLVEKSMDAIDERGKNKALITGVATGFTKLDQLTSGLQNSDLIILAARPSMGKTSFALNIARNAAVEANVPSAVFSLEMSKEQLAMRLLCTEARIDSSRLRSGFLTDNDLGALTDAADMLSRAPIYIDDTADISAMEIRAKARRLKMEKNLGLIVIDYVQLMKSRQNSERRDLEISEISRSLKALAKELNLPVVALSQLNRKLEERNDKHPQLSDLRESGALEQDADVVAFIYRDEVYNKDPNNPHRGKAEIILAKHRNGPTGTVPLTFLNSYTRFENPAFNHAPAAHE
ncbi:MAG: replicative DNA helicase [Desulfobacterales bacterium]|nr:replicative DNA helicase [Desulfobacterales bacterium]MDD3081130.1 replicative DNA helicase [Desulfobacterales bacterium]MDD3950179.1 replicative DNA helicase [Desulfobacterales bacterium]MDD4463519.1 replicative DNA helicase [Desulfobacterales bacterium]MDY0377215.1 replicative DNA helicase [Desulfobacterales bacterium]